MSYKNQRNWNFLIFFITKNSCWREREEEEKMGGRCMCFICFGSLSTIWFCLLCTNHLGHEVVVVDLEERG